MPAWPGGPCPECGEVMPENLVHCQNCRALLNPDLKTDSVEIPEFIPLQEIGSMVEVKPKGYYIACPRCQQELRIAAKYVGKRVNCKICRTPFLLELLSNHIQFSSFFADCPHCQEELRATPKYLGVDAACKYCGGHVHFLKLKPPK